jgi:DNA-binding response OmpR family regulator
MNELSLKVLKSLNVLYVEDDPIIAEQTVSLLKNYFHAVFHTYSAEEALQLFKLEHINIVITDIELPAMNGLQLCEEIRKIKHNIPIFITSMHNHKEMLMQAIKLNLVDYLIKPVSVSTITNTLMKSLKILNTNGELLLQINEDLSYYPLSAQLEVGSETIALNSKEAKLLHLLVLNKNKAVSKVTIEHALNQDEPISDSAFKAILYRLRKKVGKKSIVSISGVGIKLQIEKNNFV